MSDASASGASDSVVCATNFTPAADRALAAALHLGVALGARVVVVHVVRHEGERDQARQRLESYARQHAAGVALALLVENGGDVARAIARVARQQSAKVVTIGRHRHSQALVRVDVEDAIQDLSPCPVLEVAADDHPRQVVRQFLATAVAERHCTVCGRQVDAVVCPQCGLRIASELLTSKNRHERQEGRGLHPEDKSLAVNPLPGEPPPRRQ
jgi:K+-sensing histidine kinase KdpD